MKTKIVFLLIVLGASHTPKLAAQSTGTFILTGSMTTPRVSDTATLLADGRVLIAGGDIEAEDASSPRAFKTLSSAELYDPRTGAFTATGNMTTPRSLHTATLLPDGRVLITGGGVTSAHGVLGDLSFASAELYDPDTGTFSATGDMTTAHVGSTATLLNNGKVLIAGGFQRDPGVSNIRFLARAELYDPSTGTFTATGDMTAEWLDTATLLPNSKVLITRGDSDGPPFISNADLYDPSTGAFTAAGDTIANHTGPTATLLMNGKVLIAGGDVGDGDGASGIAELYDPVAGIFSRTGNLTTGREQHTATLLPDGTVLFVGGHNIFDLARTAEIYDPVKEAFSRTASIHTARVGHTATLLKDGRVLIAGGGEAILGPVTILSTAELYTTTPGPAIVTNVTSSAANGTYGVGAVIPIQVIFSAAVTVSGAPQLALNTGGTATYSSGSGSSSLTFNYTVGAADSSAVLDYRSTSALTLNGGTIKDAATNNAILPLSPPGQAGSLSANKSIAISTSTPVYVPTVVGLSQTAAATAIIGGGLVVGTVTIKYSAALPAGSVISESPAAGTLVSPGSAVNLVIAGFSLSPTSQSGSRAIFTLTFAVPNGYATLRVVDILINNALDGRGACYVAFVPSSPVAGSVYLVDDRGDAGGPYAGMTLPGTDLVQNSQCLILGANSSVSVMGNTLTLTLDITFNDGWRDQAPFSGNKVIYMAAQDTITGNSGWQTMGVYNVTGAAPTGPSVGGVSPGHTSSTTQAFTFTFSDTNGFADLTVLNVLINSALDGRGACYIAFVPSGPTAGSVYLVDDAGDSGGPYAGAALPGTGTIENSQCSISGVGSSVSGSGNTLSLTLNITFKPTFTGNKVIYMAGRSTALNSNWQSMGTMSVP